MSNNVSEILKTFYSPSNEAKITNDQRKIIINSITIHNNETSNKSEILKLLQINSNSEINYEEIKNKMKKLYLLFHPDKCSSEELKDFGIKAKEIFLIIDQFRKTLENPENKELIIKFQTKLLEKLKNFLLLIEKIKNPDDQEEILQELFKTNKCYITEKNLITLKEIEEKTKFLKSLRDELNIDSSEKITKENKEKIEKIFKSLEFDFHLKPEKNTEECYPVFLNCNLDKSKKKLFLCSEEDLFFFKYYAKNILFIDENIITAFITNAKLEFHIYLEIYSEAIKKGLTTKDIENITNFVKSFDSIEIEDNQEQMFEKLFQPSKCYKTKKILISFNQIKNNESYKMKEIYLKEFNKLKNNFPIKKEKKEKIEKIFELLNLDIEIFPKSTENFTNKNEKYFTIFSDTNKSDFKNKILFLPESDISAFHNSFLSVFLFLNMKGTFKSSLEIYIEEIKKGLTKEKIQEKYTNYKNFFELINSISNPDDQEEILRKLFQKNEDFIDSKEKLDYFWEREPSNWIEEKLDWKKFFEKIKNTKESLQDIYNELLENHSYKIENKIKQKIEKFLKSLDFDFEFKSKTNTEECFPIFFELKKDDHSKKKILLCSKLDVQKYLDDIEKKLPIKFKFETALSLYVKEIKEILPKMEIDEKKLDTIKNYQTNFDEHLSFFKKINELNKNEKIDTIFDDIEKIIKIFNDEIKKNNSSKSDFLECKKQILENFVSFISNFQTLKKFHNDIDVLFYNKNFLQSSDSEKNSLNEFFFNENFLQNPGTEKKFFSLNEEKFFEMNKNFSSFTEKILNIIKTLKTKNLLQTNVDFQKISIKIENDISSNKSFSEKILSSKKFDKKNKKQLENFCNEDNLELIKKEQEKSKLIFTKLTFFLTNREIKKFYLNLELLKSIKIKIFDLILKSEKTKIEKFFQNNPCEILKNEINRIFECKLSEDEKKSIKKSIKIEKKIFFKNFCKEIKNSKKKYITISFFVTFVFGFTILNCASWVSEIFKNSKNKIDFLRSFFLALISEISKITHHIILFPNKLLKSENKIDELKKAKEIVITKFFSKKNKTFFLISGIIAILIIFIICIVALKKTFDDYKIKNNAIFDAECNKIIKDYFIKNIKKNNIFNEIFGEEFMEKRENNENFFEKENVLEKLQIFFGNAKINDLQEEIEKFLDKEYEVTNENFFIEKNQRKESQEDFSKITKNFLENIYIDTKIGISF